MRVIEINVDLVDIVNGIKNSKLGNSIGITLINKIKAFWN